MIPAAYIREWRNRAPWQETDMIEQDLVICRTLVEIFNDPFLAENLAFRGGTAIYKISRHDHPVPPDKIIIFTPLGFKLVQAGYTSPANRNLTQSRDLSWITMNYIRNTAPCWLKMKTCVKN